MVSSENSDGDPAKAGLRVGLGSDRHRLEPNRPFILGAVRIDHDRGLAGHSDADVLLHAITDALLGALALGDIGEWFPDNDPVNKDRDSRDMLRKVLEQMPADRVRILHLDCTVFAQRPKLSSYKAAIRRSLADLLGLSIDRINVKAKSGESVGVIGREEAVDAQAVVLIEVQE